MFFVPENDLQVLEGASYLEPKQGWWVNPQCASEPRSSLFTGGVGGVITAIILVNWVCVQLMNFDSDASSKSFSHFPVITPLLWGSVEPLIIADW